MKVEVEVCPLGCFGVLSCSYFNILKREKRKQPRRLVKAHCWRNSTSRFIEMMMKLSEEETKTPPSFFT